MPKRPIGVIVSAHGVRGLVKVRTDAKNFKALVEKQPITIGDRTYSISVTGAISSPFIVQVEGISDRNAAEAMKGKKLYLAVGGDAQEKDEYVLEDLVGVVVEEGGVAIGTITRVLNFGAGDIVEVMDIHGGAELFPFDARTFPHVEIASRRAQFNRPLYT